MPDSIYVSDSHNQIVLVDHPIMRRKAFYDEANFQLITRQGRKPCVIIEGQQHLTFLDTTGEQYAIYEKQHPPVVTLTTASYIVTSLTTLGIQLYLLFVVQTLVRVMFSNIMRNGPL